VWEPALERIVPRHRRAAVAIDDELEGVDLPGNFELGSHLHEDGGLVA